MSHYNEAHRILENYDKVVRDMTPETAEAQASALQVAMLNGLVYAVLAVADALWHSRCRSVSREPRS